MPPRIPRFGAALARSALLLALLVLLGTAAGIKVEILSAERLEIRSLTLPDGSDIELYVLEGSPVRLRIDDDLLEGERLEIDLTNRVVRVIGFGTFASEQETVQGDDLVIVLEDETFQGRDMLIVTDTIDVVGDDASRVPGQISILAGSFSPCSRCAQDTEDYGFRAERIELFPGDRLVAFQARLLIRGVPTLLFPVLVVPLSKPDRQPRLAITTGTPFDRALVELSWPYVAGANALGSFSVRYYADVSPGQGNFFEENLLGGRIDESYLGGAIDHRFYTERGAGEFSVDYTPSFLDEAGGENDPALIEAKVAYATDPLIGTPSLEVLVERDDARRDRLVEYTLIGENVEAGVRGRFVSQGFTILEGGDPSALPSYANRNTPLRTIDRLSLSSADPPLRLGPLDIEALELDLGAFEDFSNATNRSAAASGRITAARLQERHALGVALDLLPGIGFSARTDFRGSYYSTDERLIDWDTGADLSASLGSVGSFGVAFRRNINEGETPFRFDTIALRNRSDLSAELALSPTEWLSITIGSGYVFEDTRDPDALGLQPLDSEVRLFDDRAWIGITLSNSYDLAENDPGNLEIGLDLRTLDSDLFAELNAQHTEDLLVTPDRLTGEPVDVSETFVSAAVGFTPYIEIDASVGYTYVPSEIEPDEPPAFWQPLELGVTVGTLGQADPIPGLRVAYTRDLNLGEVTDLSYEFTVRLGPVEASASQTFGVARAELGSSRYEVRWPGIAALEASGMGLIQPDWLGLPFDGDSAQNWTVSLRDAPIGRRERWRLTYKTTFDPTLEDGSGGFRNSALEPRLVLEETETGGVRFTVDLAADLRLADDALPRSYLRSGNLGLGVDLFGRVGIQGELGYLANYNPTLDELTSSRLTIDNFTVTVHPTDQLYLGAVLDDIWDLTGNIDTQSPFNFQPTVFLVWDRCCWALYAEWDTETGAISLALSAPGASEGLQQIFDTPLILPGRETAP